LLIINLLVGSLGQATITAEAYQELEAAIYEGEQFGVKTKEGLLLLETARVIHSLRAYLAQEDFTSVESILYDAASRSDQLYMDAPEIRAARDQINNRLSLSK